jgi:hypothetical protein
MDLLSFEKAMITFASSALFSFLCVVMLRVSPRSARRQSLLVAENWAGKSSSIQPDSK